MLTNVVTGLLLKSTLESALSPPREKSVLTLNKQTKNVCVENSELSATQMNLQ